MLFHCSHLFGSLNITQWKVQADKSCSQEVIINEWQAMSPQKQWDIKLMYSFFLLYPSIYHCLLCF
jgi:hypothetical protein